MFVFINLSSRLFIKRIEGIASQIELNLKEGDYKEALTELSKAEKEATEALKNLREMQEGHPP